jgi:hypothetical protein
VGSIVWSGSRPASETVLRIVRRRWNASWNATRDSRWDAGAWFSEDHFGKEVVCQLPIWPWVLGSEQHVVVSYFGPHRDMLLLCALVAFHRVSPLRNDLSEHYRGIYI